MCYFVKKGKLMIKSSLFKRVPLFSLQRALRETSRVAPVAILAASV